MINLGRYIPFFVYSITFIINTSAKKEKSYFVVKSSQKEGEKSEFFVKYVH